MAFSLQVRESVYERAGGMCERKMPDGLRCFGPGKAFHHIVPKKMGGRQGLMKQLVDTEANCMLTCQGCHYQRHSGKAWNDDAADLVPGKEVRDILLRRGWPD